MYYLIVFDSITFAKRIRDKYRFGKDYISVMHTPSDISNGSCSYSVKVKEALVDRAIAAAKSNGYKINGVFKEDAEGNYKPI